MPDDAEHALDRGPDRGARRGPRHAVALRSHRLVRASALVVLAVVTSAGAVVGASLARWQNNITRLPSIADLVVAPTPAESQVEEMSADDAFAGRAVNLLVLGSDDRSGANAALAGEADGGGSDTTLIVHLSADRTRVDVASIPRDTKATIPACHLDRDPAGPTSSAQTAKFNAAFAIGWRTGDPALAAACTISTVQTMTGLTIDGFVILDMAGFEGMVDAVGGVRVCVPEALHDEGGYTNLHLEPGWHQLVGLEALDYVRARHVAGSDGTDPARIERQQRFIGALLRTVLSSDVLTSPLSLAGFLDAATSSLTVSAELGDTGTMVGLAWALRGLEATDVTFLTVPWVYSTGGYVTWTDDAPLLWSRLLADQPVNAAPRVVEPSTGEATAGATPGASTDADAGAPPDAGAGAPPDAGAGAPTAEPDFVVRTAEDPDEVLCG